MIKKMRYQFLLVTMMCISFIFLLILSVINISMTLSSRNQGYALLYRIATMSNEKERNIKDDFPSDEIQNGRQKIPPKEPVGGFDVFRSFSVQYNPDGTVADVFYNEEAGLTKEEILSLTAKIMENPKPRGVLSKYLYIVQEQSDGIRIFLIDYSVERSLSLRLFRTCLFIGLLGILFLFFAVIFLSRWIVKPVQTAFDRQKQFIADASHELKTPLTIITANAEVLAASGIENKWVHHILSQTKRMNALIKNLLELARLDSYSLPLQADAFNLSMAVKNAALSFESLAYEYGKNYEIHIRDGLFMKGDESSIKQLTTILLDNAFKYSEEKGSVTIHLLQHGEKKILTVQNSGKGIAKAEQERIFERFYRSDSSRSREFGGYGLGLAIAYSIVLFHKGHINVKSDESTYTRFTVTLP